MDRPFRRKTSRLAFSLVELLVVLGVITILLSLLLPALGSAVASARATRCAAQMRGYGQAMALYANDNHGLFFPLVLPIEPYNAEFWAAPVLGGDVVWRDALRHERSDALICPSDPFGGDPDPAVPTGNSYLINSAISAYDTRLGGPFDRYKPSPPSQYVVMFEKHPSVIGWQTANFFTPLHPELGDIFDGVDLVRHEPRRRSNHLFGDLHVDGDQTFPNITW